MLNDFYFASYKTIEKEPKVVLDQLKETRFDGLEILADGKHDLSKKENKRIFKQQRDNLSYSVHAPYEDINLASDNEQIRKNSVDKIKKLIGNAKEIQANFLTIHPGFFSNKKPGVKKRAWEQNQKSLREIAEEAEKQEINIGLENLPSTNGVLGKTSYEINGLIDSVNNDYLSISMDLGHANTMNQINNFLDQREKIEHIHLHDNKGEKDSHRAIGEGEINFSSILKELRDYKGVYVIESRSLEQGELSLDRIKKKSILFN